MELLRSLLDAGARGVLPGLFCDAAIATEAGNRGVGSRFLARFDRGREGTPLRPR